MARHRDDDRDREQRHRDELYRGLPSVTNRVWGPTREDDGFGYPGQGGFGDFRQPPRDTVARPEHAPRIGGHRGRGPRNFTRSDERIADDLIERLTRDDDIDAREILIAVESGVVTLTGEVPERRMKHLAEDLAVAVQGVRDVHNRLHVDRGAHSFGPPGQAVRSGFDQQGSGFSSSSYDQRDDIEDRDRDENRRRPMRQPREH
ncbi:MULTISPECIES: BON domain-containing protein [unclassified Lysobacter]|uniref:BON domain-containing protein n=1 Tax=unclassified Lysobacter TaxID=2635362 RepID=UPI001C23972E|nr:BON domain-containing protein [Lysobacter sp. MMG2]MBU8974660.1 BON domain-containing protein [Lysobacter sp. MMG2]